MIEKEAEHLTRGVGPSRIRVGPGGAATRPGMAGSVDVPLLEIACPLASAWRVRLYACLPAPDHNALFCDGRSNLPLRDDVIAVAGVDRGVMISMEHDGGDNRASAPRTTSCRRAFRRGWRLALPHGGERGRQIARDSAGEARMHTHRGVEIGVVIPMIAAAAAPAERPAT